jgi:hypothetical protein
MDDIFFNGRHLDIFFCFTLQYCMGIGPDFRNNLDYVFAFKEAIYDQKVKLWKYFFGMFDFYQDFAKVFKKMATGYDCLVLDTTSGSYEIEDCLRWYRARVYKKFAVGGRSAWWVHTKCYRNDLGGNQPLPGKDDDNGVTKIGDNPKRNSATANSNSAPATTTAPTITTGATVGATIGATTAVPKRVVQQQQQQRPRVLSEERVINFSCDDQPGQFQMGPPELRVPPNGMQQQQQYGGKRKSRNNNFWQSDGEQFEDDWENNDEDEFEEDEDEVWGPPRKRATRGGGSGTKRKQPLPWNVSRQQQQQGGQGKRVCIQGGENGDGRAIWVDQNRLQHSVYDKIEFEKY